MTAARLYGVPVLWGSLEFSASGVDVDASRRHHFSAGGKARATRNAGASVFVACAVLRSCIRFLACGSSRAARQAIVEGGTLVSAGALHPADSP